MVIRIVDIGSNSVKASLYTVDQGRHRLISKEKLDYSLGNAVFSEGSIPDSGTEKVAEFVAARGARNLEAPHFTFALATSAVRSASNRADFVRRLREKTGIEVRVLGGAEESYLIHAGIVSQAGAKPNELVKTIDIGGGSAEVSCSRGGTYLFGKSYDLGAIRISRKFVNDKPFTREILRRITEHALGEFAAGPAAPADASDRAIGSSGNVRAIARMAETVRSPSFTKTVSALTPGTLEDVIEASLNLAPSRIAEFFNLTPERARIIPAGLAVLLAGMRHFGMRRLEVTDAGLREGAVDFWSRHGHFNLPVPSEDTHENNGKTRR